MSYIDKNRKNAQQATTPFAATCSGCTWRLRLKDRIVGFEHPYDGVAPEKLDGNSRPAQDGVSLRPGPELETQDQQRGDRFGRAVGKDVDDRFGTEFFVFIKGNVEHLLDDAE